MTDPTPPRSPDDRPAMGDHPELEADAPQREEPVGNEQWLPFVMGGLVILILVLVVILFLVL